MRSEVVCLLPIKRGVQNASSVGMIVPPVYSKPFPRRHRGSDKLVARYDKSDDRTRDRSGRIVGNGDQRLRKLGDR
jgi:hypothetical protein